MARTFRSRGAAASSVVAARLAVSFSVLVMSGVPSTMACGYHSPQTIARGMLNWTFPKALYVQSALWRAENAELLPPRSGQRSRNPLAAVKTSAELRTLAHRLSLTHKSDVSRPNLAIVLIGPVLWTRLEAKPMGYAAQVHVDGPKPGDVVMVTGEQVISALLQGVLDAATAEKHGLFRLYRRPELHQQIRILMQKASVTAQPANAGNDVKLFNKPVYP